MLTRLRFSLPRDLSVRTDLQLDVFP